MLKKMSASSSTSTSAENLTLAQNTKRKRISSNNSLSSGHPDDSISETVETQEIPVLEENTFDKLHSDYCVFCHFGGDLLLCAVCTVSCHLSCVWPPLDVEPDDDWICPLCKVGFSFLL